MKEEKKVNLVPFNDIQMKLQKLQIAFIKEQLRLKKLIRAKDNKLKKNSSKIQQSKLNSFCKEGQRNVSYEKNKIRSELSTNSVLDLLESAKKKQIQYKLYQSLPFTIQGSIPIIKEDLMFSEQDIDCSSIMTNEAEKDGENYDYTVRIPSITSLSKSVGWIIPPCTSHYLSMKDDIYARVGFLGEMNSGKTFLLSQICGSKMKKCSYESHTDSLSFKYYLKNLFIDSKGSNLPIYVRSGTERTDKENDITNSYRCKERFIENFILNESQLVIYVMGYASQSQIDKLNSIKQLKNKFSMIVVHNLPMFTTLNELLNYYQKVIKPAFSLYVPQPIFEINTQESNEIVGYYFKEKDDDENNNKREVIHLLFGNATLPAFKELNKYTIKYITTKIESKNIHSDEFKIDEALKANIIKLISQYYNVYKNNKEVSITYENIHFQNNKLVLDANYLMKLKPIDFESNTISNEGVFKVKEYRDKINKEKTEYTVKFSLPQNAINKQYEIMDSIVKKVREIRLRIYGDLEVKKEQKGIKILENKITRYNKYELIINLNQIHIEIYKEISSTKESSRDIMFKFSLKGGDGKAQEIELID